MIPEDIISEIKYRNDIETAVSSYVNLKRRGKNLVGLCPFHSEKTPSFTVYPENGSFYCFGCGAGGDVFTFTGLIENLDISGRLHHTVESVAAFLQSYTTHFKADNKVPLLDKSVVEITAVHTCVAGSADRAK